MRIIFTRITTSIVLLFLLSTAGAQNRFFTDAPEAVLKNASQKRVIIPDKYRTLQLDTQGLLSFLQTLPAEQDAVNRTNTPILEIPMPDGSTERFNVWETQLMEPGLAARCPDVKVITGQGIGDRTATLRATWTKFGFNVMILSPVTGAVFIDPYAQGTITNYITYFKKDFIKKEAYVELPVIDYNAARPASPANIMAGVCIGTQLRKYRLAVACTHEYAIAATGLASPTVADARAKIIISVARVSGVYETEVSIRLILIATEDDIIFPIAGLDPFTGNNSPSVLINESQSIIDSYIGTTLYDIGHTFSTGGGGLAGLGVVCRASSKASGVTGITNPVGDPYDIDYVAHEMGHQFGANHPFNSLQGSCNGNGASSSNAEPGSGSTIMAYAGICSAADLQPHSDPQFHAVSFNSITTYTVNGTGNSCAVQTATGNTPPVVSPLANYIIPISTPFALTGSATDADGDALTYSWEQVDVGGPFGEWNVPVGNAPLFRSFPPVTSPTRYFPKASDIYSNNTNDYSTPTIGEILPTYARTMHFRLTARDNRAAGGGVCFAENTVTVNAAAGPLEVTSPNTTGIVWYINDFKTVTWDPAGTAGAPINCSNVTIQLSVDGGLTFPTVLLASTPNDGAEEIQVPNLPTTQARIRVMAVGNVFFDISNKNFTIQASPTSTFVFNNPPPVAICGGTSGTATLKSGALGGFSTTITVSATGNPVGTNIVFGSTTLAPGTSTSVTMNITGSPAAGTYNVTVTGTAGATSKSRIIAFVIGSGIAAPSNLTAPANNTLGISLLPTFNWDVVPGAISYTLEIATSPTFTTGLQTITNILTNNYSLSTALSEYTVYYWRLKTVSGCGTSTGSAANNFRTGISTCKTSPNVPVTISASGTPTITSTLTIPAAFGSIISDLNVVGLVGTHTYMHDLTFTLKSPAGTSVVLFGSLMSGAQNCSSDNFDLNLDDQSPTTTFPCPPIGGVTIKPTNPLSAFNGQNSTGIWTLTVSDAATDDGGSLDGWGLSINNNSTICSIVVPVTWISFTGKKEQNNTSMLHWSVNEYNNHHYEIERSIDGTKFVKIGDVFSASATGNGNLHQYAYNDLRPVMGRNFYRLKQVDNDGRFTYSVIVTLVFDKIKSLWTIYPNPAKDNINIVSNQADNNIQVELFDAAGKLVFSKAISNTVRGELVSMATGTFARGVYSLRIKSGNEVRTEKIVLQ